MRSPKIATLITRVLYSRPSRAFLVAFATSFGLDALPRFLVRISMCEMSGRSSDSSWFEINLGFGFRRDFVSGAARPLMLRLIFLVGDSSESASRSRMMAWHGIMSLKIYKGLQNDCPMEKGFLVQGNSLRV
jgi:hypothetical protein